VDTRQRILRAALEAYGQKGFRGATTRNIASLAGVNEVTIFRHFGSKQALLTEALREQVPGSPPAILPTVPRDPHRELIGWTEAHLRSLAKQGQILRASMGDIEERPELAGGSVTLQKMALAELTAYLEQLRQRGHVRTTVDINAAASMLIATLFADATSGPATPGGSALEERARDYAAVVLTALGVAGDPAGKQQPARAQAPPSMPDATGA
jgi:AcrR family transcriptional regulator